MRLIGRRNLPLLTRSKWRRLGQCRASVLKKVWLSLTQQEVSDPDEQTKLQAVEAES